MMCHVLVPQSCWLPGQSTVQGIIEGLLIHGADTGLACRCIHPPSISPGTALLQGKRRQLRLLQRLLRLLILELRPICRTRPT